MKRILVLGGTQFFGKKLVEKLLEKGKQVTIATRGLTPDPFGNRVERIILDREHRGEMKQAFENKSWDVVYDQTCLSPEEAKEAIDALKGKVNRYILTSSQAVYPYGTNHKEENFDPFSYTYTLKGRREYSGYKGYQEAKRAAEAVLFNEKDLQAVAVRMPIVIGEDDFTKRLQFHVDKVVKGEEIGIENGDLRYSFITSEEAAEFLYLLGEDNFVGPINPGFKDDLSLSELIELIERTVGKKAVLTQEITPANVTPYRLPGSWSINNEKAEQLGFQFTNQEKALVELIKFYSTVNA
jgi:nucleoside-diphosphate-sugar epimerase